jgi:poly(3-hydroxybutyrate) depolymerase
MTAFARRYQVFALMLLCAATAALLVGCPPPPGAGHGRGKESYRTCRATNRGYYLYIPENYNKERRYPLVLTLHGMKPYDSAHPHIVMWDQYADKYGYIVLAPVLQTSDSFGQFPLKAMGSAETADLKHVMATLDEVVSDWRIDKQAILLSSWSMGGYLAHYIACEYGDRFTAFAPLQSNCCTGILNSLKARQWIGKLPIFIFYGTSDLAVVTNECKDALEWYRHVGYNPKVVTKPVGHERHPELAAEFFEGVLAAQRKNIEIVMTPPGGNEPAPLAVNLWPALSSKIGEVRTYVWDFGKELGGACYQKSPNVLIHQAGDYPVRLTVVDSAGVRYSAQATIHVPPAKSALAPGTNPR